MTPARPVVHGRAVVLRGGSLPGLFHLLDERVLGRVFTAAGFEIERLELFPRPDYPADIRLDGRESAGLVAVKK